MRKTEWIEDDDEDEDDIVQDGHSVRTSIFAMDGLQRAIHDHPRLETAMTTNRALDYAARCLTGDRSALIGDAAQGRLDDAYAERRRLLSDAWRNPGSANAAPVVRANDDHHDVGDVEAAYAERDRLLTTNWRSR